MIHINRLQLTKLKFTLKFTQTTYLLPFIGNTLRGALGQSLYKNFPYAYQNILKVDRGQSIPNPFVISVPYPSKGTYLAGETLSFYVTLFGSACALEQNLIDAAKMICEGKLTNTQLIESQQVYSRPWSDDGAKHIPSCNMLTIDFLTPTEIYVKSQLAKQVEFTTFMDRLFGRISGILDNYSENEFILPYSLIANKPLVRSEYDLHVVKLRTGEQPIAGFCGQVRYYGDVTRYLPYIDLGSQIHIGKKTTRSCGQYVFSITT